MESKKIGPIEGLCIAITAFLAGCTITTAIFTVITLKSVHQ